MKQRMMLLIISSFFLCVNTGCVAVPGSNQTTLYTMRTPVMRLEKERKVDRLSPYLSPEVNETLSDIPCDLIQGKIWSWTSFICFTEIVGACTVTTHEETGEILRTFIWVRAWKEADEDVPFFHDAVLLHEHLHAAWANILTEDQREKIKTLVNNPANIPIVFIYLLPDAVLDNPEELWVIIGCRLARCGPYYALGYRMMEMYPQLFYEKSTASHFTADIRETFRGILHDEFLDPLRQD